MVFSSTSTFTFFRAFGASLVAFCVRKVDVRGKVDVQAPKSQLLYVNIDVPYVNKKHWVLVSSVDSTSVASGSSVASDPGLTGYLDQNCSISELIRTSGSCRSTNTSEINYTCSLEYPENAQSDHGSVDTRVAFFSSIYPLKYSRFANLL